MSGPSSQARVHPDDENLMVDVDGTIWRRINQRHKERSQWLLRKLDTDKDGYRKVNIKGLNRFVHRGVYRVHVGPLVQGLVVCHLNGDPTDNRPENLLQATQWENTQHKHLHGTILCGDRHPSRRPEHNAAKAAAVRGALAEAQWTSIGQLKKGERPRIAREHGVNLNFVDSVRRGNWQQ